MKKIILLTLLILVVVFAEARNKKPKQLRLTITYVHRDGADSEVWARMGGRWYMAKCNPPDSVQIGTVLSASAYRGQSDCICLFKRIK